MPVRPEPSATVEQVWGRAGPSGGDARLLVVSALLGVIGVSVFLALERDVPAGVPRHDRCRCPSSSLVAYPILITLERPVRITPEQAVNDYYSALSHHAPHYRRMWLLLSDAGRVSGSYASFEGFRAYWKRRLAELRAGKAGGFTPLKFQIEDFRSPRRARG